MQVSAELQSNFLCEISIFSCEKRNSHKIFSFGLLHYV